MNQSDFGQLIVFHTIVKENSITQAAKKLGVAVPSVSKSLRLLEQKIGTPLFLRTTRTLQLTEAGNHLWQQTEPAIQALQNSWQSASDQHHKPSGTIRITLSQVHFNLIFKPIYAEFCQRYPEIILEFSIQNATVDLIQQNFDFGVRFGDSLTENVVAKAIYPEVRQGLYVSKQYAEQNGIPQTPDELKHYPMINFRFMSSNRIAPLFFNINGEQVLQEVNNYLIFNDTEAIINATEQGLGIGRIFDTDPKTQDLVPVLEQYWLEFPKTYIYYLPNSYKPKKLQVLLDFVVEKWGNVLGN